MYRVLGHRVSVAAPLRSSSAGGRQQFRRGRRSHGQAQGGDGAAAPRRRRRRAAPARGPAARRRRPGGRLREGPPPGRSPGPCGTGRCRPDRAASRPGPAGRSPRHERSPAPRDRRPLPSSRSRNAPGDGEGPAHQVVVLHQQHTDRTRGRPGRDGRGHGRTTPVRTVRAECRSRWRMAGAPRERYDRGRTRCRPRARGTATPPDAAEDRAGHAFRPSCPVRPKAVGPPVLRPAAESAVAAVTDRKNALPGKPKVGSRNRKSRDPARSCDRTGFPSPLLI